MLNIWKILSRTNSVCQCVFDNAFCVWQKCKNEQIYHFSLISNKKQRRRKNRTWTQTITNESCKMKTIAAAENVRYQYFFPLYGCYGVNVE